MRLDLGVSLEEARAAALEAIDAAAAAARRRYLTAGTGQEMEYLATEAEAQAFAAAGFPAAINPGSYPFLEAELAALRSAGASATLTEVAQAVLAQAALWREAGAQIKALRRGAKLAVEQATTHAQIRAALAIDWPEPGRQASA